MQTTQTDQNINQTPQTQSTSTPIAIPNSIQPTSTSKPTTSTVSISKEGAPISIDTKNTIEVEVVAEHKQIDPEVEKMVEVVPDVIDNTTELEAVRAQINTSTSFINLQKIQIPMSDEKIMEGRHQPVTSALRWLVELYIYILRQGHIQLKEIKGKITRVFVQ
ncbi:MAG: hypothetical protein WCO06_04195 [Candidatus Roizmanbacteria bacterium]